MLLQLPRFCSANGMFVERRVPSFDEIIRKSKYSILCRIKMSNNILVKSIYLSDVYYTSHFFCDLYDSLYVYFIYICMKIEYYLTHLHVYNSHLYSCV